MDILVIGSYLSLAFLMISTAAFLFFNRKYFIYHHNLLYIIGLMYSRCLTNSAVVSILMWYFSFYEGNLVVSAVLSNIQDSLSSLLVIVMANISDSVFGRFRTLLFSNTAYIGGLILLWMFNPYDVKWLIVIALVLIALGTSGYKILDDVLFELVEDIGTLKDRERSGAVNGIDTSKNRKKSAKVRADMWSRIAYVSGTISAILWVSPSGTAGVVLSWRRIFLICIIFMTTSLIRFVQGYKLYYQELLNQRPAMMFFRVFCLGGLCKCHSRRTTTISRCVDPSQPSAKRENIGTMQDAEGKDTISVISHEQDAVNVKRLLKLFPMWAAYFVVALISATGSTFFFEQSNNLKTSEKLPIQLYTNLIQDVSSFAIPFIFKWAFKWATRSRNNEEDEKDEKLEKFKIGAGMLCSIICCIFAWQLEVHRLKAVNKLVDDQNENTSIIFLWLVPQFSLLGCMEGLTNEGLLNFFKSQVDNKDLEKYGEEYIAFVLGVGKLFTIALIIIFKRKLGWFSYTINDSRLDKYYKILVYACSVNFVYYCIIATSCLYRKDPKKLEASANNVQNHA